MTREPWFASLRQWVRWVFQWRVQTWPERREFAVLATHWLYFTNHAYAGEKRFWIRVGQWRKSFGPRKTPNSHSEPDA